MVRITNRFGDGMDILTDSPVQFWPDDYQPAIPAKDVIIRSFGVKSLQVVSLPSVFLMD